MYPLGQCAAYFQSAVEAEGDVCALVLAMRSSPDAIRHIVLKYVVTAELSFVDALEYVFANGKGGFWSRAPKTTPLGIEVRAYRKEYESLKNSLCPVLRKTVRNRGAAHKDRLFVETEAELMRSLNSKDPPRLFGMARHILDFLAAKPIWTWGYSRPGNRVGGVLASCARPIQRQSTVEPSDGFGTRGFAGFGPELIVEELEFEDLRAANSWADSLSFACVVDDEPPLLQTGSPQ